MSESAQTPEERIFHAFAGRAPDGWTHGEIRTCDAGKTSERQLRAITSDGSEHGVSVRGFALSHALQELRTAMARPGTGAWLSAVVKLTSDGGFSMDVDYDHEPEWKIPVVPQTYVEEQELFPRDLEHQPQWYRDKLRESGNSELTTDSRQ